LFNSWLMNGEASILKVFSVDFSLSVHEKWNTSIFRRNFLSRKLRPFIGSSSCFRCYIVIVFQDIFWS
jgi:hypothetical protein